ncbi:hypothetical protein ATANTOWER_024392 [Ataeniobius toweri]|uniref:Uncharacterized protein n=1 Tax=Ataeniobius toweri TaxID=208326 RepID=A0ABU7AT52_9TELE|nr:hypothetical protein [Ataeniobius toweri]
MGGAAASLGDSAVADEDVGLLIGTRDYSLQPSRQLAGKPPLQTSQQRPWETPPRRVKSRKVLRADVSCGGRRTWASLPDQDAHPGKQVENGAEPPQAPSAPAVGERAEPPDRSADVSLPPPSALEPSDPWRFSRLV